MLTVEQLAEIREWVGSTPDDATVEATFDALGGVRDTIRRILRMRRADMIANPSQFAIPGEYSQSTVQNLKSIDELLAELETADLETEVASVTVPSSVKHFVRYGDDCYTGR